MHISTLCSYRPSNDPTVDQQPYGSSVSYISQTYSYISVSLGQAYLSFPLRSVCLSSLHNHPEDTHEHRFYRRHSVLLFLCAVTVRTCFLMLLCVKAIPRQKNATQVRIKEISDSPTDSLVTGRARCINVVQLRDLKDLSTPTGCPKPLY